MKNEGNPCQKMSIANSLERFQGLLGIFTSEGCATVFCLKILETDCGKKLFALQVFVKVILSLNFLKASFANF